MEYTVTEYKILSACAAICGVFSFLVGGFDPPIYALLALITIDFGTGLYAGWVNAVVSSRAGYNGLKRKGFIMLVILLANLIDIGMGMGHVFRWATVGAYSILEGVSIVENLDRANCGEFIPKWFRDKLIQIRTEKGV